jgi:ABC-type multidrug transport system permease subunit
MSIVYWMCSLNPSIDRYAWSLLLIILTVQACISFGHFLSAVSPSVSLASELAGPVVGPLMIFAGHFLNTESIPKYFLWLKYLSWLSYSNEAFLINQWHGLEGISCSQDSLRCFTTGKHVLDYLNIDPVNKHSRIFFN